MMPRIEIASVASPAKNVSAVQEFLGLGEVHL
jgi:hypothetical protein